MQYLFCDTEGNVESKEGLRTFGFVLTDENFNVIEDREVYISIWKNGKQKPATQRKWELPFSKTYAILRDYLTAPDCLVMGFAVDGDARIINQACVHYKKAPLRYAFFDVRGLFCALYPEQEKTTLADCVQFLGIEETFEYHKSLQDARATVAVMKAICEKQGASMQTLVDGHAECSGHAENYGVNLQIDEKKQTLTSCSAEHFKIRVDLPVVYFKKQIGYINMGGSRDGVVYFYDLALNKLFRDRHSHKVAKLKGNWKQDCLVSEFFEEATERGKQKLQKKAAEFYNSPEPLQQRYFVVSLEFLGAIEGGEFELKFGQQYLKEIGRRDPYYNLLSGARVAPSAVVRRFYTAETFGLAFRKNAKWNYGDKNPEIVVGALPRVTQSDLEEGDELYVPRLFEYVLMERLGPNKVIACAPEHQAFAHGQKVVGLSACDLPDARIRLIAQEEGGVFAYLPCEYPVHCGFYDCEYVLPLLIRRRLPDDYFAPLEQ